MEPVGLSDSITGSPSGPDVSSLHDTEGKPKSNAKSSTLKRTRRKKKPPQEPSGSNTLNTPSGVTPDSSLSTPSPASKRFKPHPGELSSPSRKKFHTSGPSSAKTTLLPEVLANEGDSGSGLAGVGIAPGLGQMRWVPQGGEEAEEFDHGEDVIDEDDSPEDVAGDDEEELSDGGMGKEQGVDLPDVTNSIRWQASEDKTDTSKPQVDQQSPGIEDLEPNKSSSTDSSGENLAITLEDTIAQIGAHLGQAFEEIRSKVCMLNSTVSLLDLLLEEHKERNVQLNSQIENLSMEIGSSRMLVSELSEITSSLREEANLHYANGGGST